MLDWSEFNKELIRQNNPTDRQLFIINKNHTTRTSTYKALPNTEDSEDLKDSVASSLATPVAAK